MDGVPQGSLLPLGLDYFTVYLYKSTVSDIWKMVEIRNGLIHP